MENDGRWLLTLRDRYIPRSATAEEMSCIDENSNALGIPVQSLMENAGAGVAALIDREYAVRGKKVLIVAGTGNKGGDGFAACRHLLNRGARVSLVLLGDKDEIRSAEARSNWQVLERMDAGLTLFQVDDSSNLQILRHELAESNLVVDAMLGTGVKGKLREPFFKSVRFLNDSHRPIVSIDTPTGLDPTTGEVQGESVRPELTVTLHKLKAGLVRSRRLAGKVLVLDIGIPLEAELFSGPGDARRVTGQRRPFSSKRDHGYVLVVGGSDIYSGAPGLTALAALRTGAGLCMVAAPETACHVIKSFSPDLIVYPLQGEAFASKHVRHISEKILKRVNSVVIGPGIGSRDETDRGVQALVKESKRLKLPLVLDADAIRSFSRSPGQLKGTGAILTPNSGEFKAIAGLDVGERWDERVEPTVGLAKRTGCTILLKGHHTVVTDGSRLKVNRTGNPGMGTGGTGDVLSGIVAAYLAQGSDPFQAAVGGAYVHGRAGDLAYEERGYHLLASDLVEKLPSVLKPFDKPA